MSLLSRITRLLSNSTYQSERANMQKRGTWGDNIPTVEMLISYLEAAHFTTYRPTQGMSIYLTVRHPNIDLLVQRLQNAHWIMEANEDVPVLTLEPHQRSLDEFLVSTLNIAIPPQEAVPVLLERAKQFVGSLQMQHSDESNREGYYYRHYSVLISDLRVVLEVLYSIRDERPRNRS